MIVLGSISASSVVRQSASKNAIFVNQPFGPRKMSRALAAALQSRSQSDPTSENQTLGAIATSPSSLHILTKPSPVISNSDPPPTYTESRPSTRDESIPATPTSPENNRTSQNGDTSNGALSNLRKVLLVEDNSINMKLLVATMRKLKRPYTSANNGLEAVSAYSSAPASHALILMDISMPVMDGFTATELIRSLEDKNKWSRCTIIALTGVGDAEAKKRAFLAGVDDFMTKPVSMAKLGGIINSLEGSVEDTIPENQNKNNENKNNQKNNKNNNNNNNEKRDSCLEKGLRNGHHPHPPRHQHAVQQPA